MQIYGKLWRRKTHQRKNQFVDLFMSSNHSSNEEVHQQNHHRNRNVKKRQTKPKIVKIVNEAKQHTSSNRKLIITKSPEFGRSIHAAESMRAGEVVLITDPFASVVQTQTNIRYCLKCHATDVKFIVCKSCKLAFYCSTRCKNANLSHKFECGTQFHAIKDLNIKCAIQMVLEAMVAFEKFEDLRDFVHQSIENRNELPTDSNLLSKLDCILKLQPMEFQTDDDVNEARETASNAYKYIITFPKVRKYFKLDNKEGSCFLQHFLAHNVSVIFENGFEVELSTKKGNCDRTLIYDILSFFNHSCSPNLFNCIFGNQMVCTTSRRIQRGEQLFISYRPFDHVSKVKRQKILLDNWNFECHCDRCECPRDANCDEILQANQLNKRQVVSQLNKSGEWTPLQWAYTLRYIELLGIS